MNKTYDLTKKQLIDNRIALPIMWASTADIKHDNDVEMDGYIKCTDTLTLMVLKCPIDMGFDFVMVTDPEKDYTQRTGWMVASDVEAWNEDEIKKEKLMTDAGLNMIDTDWYLDILLDFMLEIDVLKYFLGKDESGIKKDILKLEEACNSVMARLQKGELK